jgi:ArsR family transcriptional regulator, virulence genes transcriptional regulator
MPVRDAVDMRRKAAEVSAVLEAVGNERRLLILCALVEAGEATVSALSEAAGLCQSATSQHLAKLREENVVAFRRDSQTSWYRIADPRVEELFASLHRIFCRNSKTAKGPKK